MENNDEIVPLNPYEEQLLTINGTKFTHREIDVIACIFHTRGAGKIATLLSISSRTVETHTANVMRKMDTNSREGIIDFLEKRGHTTLIKKHYQVLLLQNNFKKRLQDVHHLLRDQKNVFCVIYDSQDEEIHFLTDTLVIHFNLCGIKTVLYEEDTQQYLSDLKPLQDAKYHPHLIYIASQKFLKQHPLNEKDKTKLYSTVWPTITHDTPSITYALFKVNPPNIPSNYSQESVVCFDGSVNYYFSFFNLLKTLLANSKLDEINSSFQKHCESTISQIEQEAPSSDAQPPTVSSQSFFSKKQLSNLMVISATFVGALYLGIYLMNYYKVNGIVKGDSKANRSIRSDLIVPSQRTFLSRPNIMAKIEEGLKGKEGIQTVAIVGIGGAGKSTIARRYALTQNFNVVWEVNATTKETLMSSFERLAYALCKSEEEKRILHVIQNIKNDVERGDKVLLFVKGKLKSNSNWFLIYDNVEKFTSIRKYFPCDSTVWGNGKIIITTTNSNTKNNSLINNFIYIGELSPKEKLHLFSKIMCKENENFDAVQEAQSDRFLNDIPPFPLDVSIAAYYLKSTNTPYKKYLERLKQDNKDFETIQIDVVKEASGYTKTRYNLITLSLMQLIDTHKDFEDLLLFISLLDYKNIPTALLSSYKGDTVVDNFIYNLKQYSLITTESVENSALTFSIHKTTQEIILAYLTKSLALNKDSPLLTSFGNTLENYIVEAVDNEDFSKMKLLVPHCEAFLSHSNLITESTKSAIGGALGCIYYYLRHNIKAKQLLEENLKSLIQCSGDQSDKIARLLVYLGNFYRYVGDFEKAKTLLTQSLTIYKKNPNYHRKARALGYLGAVYKDLGDYRTSKELLTQSLEIYEKHRQNSIGHAWILVQLGNIYTIFGDYEKAKSLLEKSLAIYKEHSEDYVGVGWVIGYLGALHILLGDLDQAQNLLEQSLAITRKYFSDDHIFIATRSSYLGNVYALKGDYQKAKSLLTASLKIHENNYGKNNIETARVLRMMGEAYALEGDFDTAEDFINKSLLVFQQKNYPEGYKSLESLADLYLKKAAQAASEGDPKQEQAFKIQSIHYLNQSLDILKDCFDKNSPHIQKTNEKLNNIQFK